MAEIKEKITTGAIRVAGISVPDINAVPATEIQEIIKDVKEEMVTAKAPACFVMTLLAFIVSYLFSLFLIQR